MRCLICFSGCSGARMSSESRPTIYGDLLEKTLKEGERVLWQGRPDGRIVFSTLNVGVSVFGFVLAGYMLVGFLLRDPDVGSFGVIVALFCVIGIALGIGSMVWSAFVRRRSWYALTNHRAFILTDLPVQGRKLLYYPILPGTQLDFRDGRLPSIIFAQVKTGGARHTKVRNVGSNGSGMRRRCLSCLSGCSGGMHEQSGLSRPLPRPLGRDFTQERRNLVAGKTGRWLFRSSVPKEILLDGDSVLWCFGHFPFVCNWVGKWRDAVVYRCLWQR